MDQITVTLQPYVDRPLFNRTSLEGLAGWADPTGQVHATASGAAGNGIPVWVVNK